jgi:cystathionine beta-lyase
MPYDFDRLIDRRSSNSLKWKFYGQDVLPLWVADMDFAVPEPILAALRRALEHGIFGYDIPSPALREAVLARMEGLYGWRIAPEAVVVTPGVIAGFTAAARSLCRPGEGVLVQPPVYPPFLKLHHHTGLKRQDAELRRIEQGKRLRYEIDWETLEAAFDSGGVHTGMFLLCSPQNPTGLTFGRQDLLRIAELCARHDAFLCSDEIHSELLLGGASHLPAASLDPEIARRTITLIAPSKTFNVPGLFCGFAIIPDEAIRRRYRLAMEEMAHHVTGLGMTAAWVAFSGQCDDWLAELRAYLTANRDFLVSVIESQFDGVRITVPDATYLAWLDCRQLVQSGKIEGSPHKFFLEKAKVALNEGADFGPGGEGFVRLNFGCPRRTLEEALDRMKAALA